MEYIETKSMLPVGTLLQGGKYRIERYLSSGGFGNTYVATNTEFDEEVAIKEFYMKGVNERDEDSFTVTVGVKSNTEQFLEQREKFKKEARRLRKLKHEHIVSVHDLFEENGTAYYVFDLPFENEKSGLCDLTNHGDSILSYFLFVKLKNR